MADGTDTKVVLALKKATEKANAGLKTVAPTLGGTVAADGKFIAADFQLARGSSVLFDTVFLALSGDGADALSNEAAAVAWVQDAFAHLKVIGATAESQVLLDKAGVVADDDIVMDASPEAFLTRAAAGRVWKREPEIRTVY